MPAIYEVTNHGTVDSLATAVTALRSGRDKAGFGNRVYSGPVTTTYNDIYSFTNGTGTYATTYIRMSNTANSHIYTQARAVNETNGVPNGGISDAGVASTAEVGNSSIRAYFYNTGIAYRSLSFKPSAGSSYGCHIFQMYDSVAATWVTALGELFIKAQNTPSSFNVNTCASTAFMFFDTRILRYPANAAIVYHDGPRWVYTDQPYTGWGGATPTGTYNRTAIFTRNSAGTTSYAEDGGTTTVTSLTTQGRHDTHNHDIFAAACLPMTLGVWDLEADGITAKLARPFVVRHRMMPMGSSPNDICVGPNYVAGTVLEVSPTEAYTSIGASLYIRTT